MFLAPCYAGRWIWFWNDIDRINHWSTNHQMWVYFNNREPNMNTISKQADQCECRNKTWGSAVITHHAQQQQQEHITPAQRGGKCREHLSLDVLRDVIDVGGPWTRCYHCDEAYLLTDRHRSRAARHCEEERNGERRAWAQSVSVYLERRGVSSPRNWNLLQLFNSKQNLWLT